MPETGGRHVLLVAGTGRSGTSTLVGVLQRHGFHVPLPEVAHDESDPRGFGEPRWAVDLHSRLLRRAGVQVADSRPLAWDLAAERCADEETRDTVRGWLAEQLTAHDRLVVKDPRIVWFLPLWTEAARELGAEPTSVTMLRPPPETVGSRRTYYHRQLEDPHAIASWINLAVGTEQATRGLRRGFVRYHDLLDDWRPALEQAWRQAGPDGTPPPPSQDPGEFIDPGLRRMRLAWDDLVLPPRLEALAGETWECLDLLAGPDADDAATRDRLDRVRLDYAAYYAEAEAVAHSSVIAARRAGRHTPASDAPQRRRRSRTADALRMLPPVLRRRVPQAVQRRARGRRGGGG